MGGCFVWPPPRRSVGLYVAIPGSVLRVEETMVLKAVKAGLIARALAAFRVDELIVYADPDTTRSDIRILVSLLRYMLIPPHLRKKAAPLSPELRAAGVLPPLRTVNHIAPEEVREGDVLDVYVEECGGEECRAYLGKPGYGRIRGRLKPGTIVAARVVSTRGGEILLEKTSWAPLYTGFKVRTAESIHQAISMLKKRGALTILASKNGKCLADTAEELAKKVEERKKAGVILGGPYRCPYEYTDHKLYDAIVNTIPKQGTLTVRTEEALIATLSALTNTKIIPD